METAYQKYKRVVMEQPACEDSWFAEALARYRGGDDRSRLQILGSCLRIPMGIVEKRFHELGENDLLAHIQDANLVMDQALTTFAGASTEEFLQYLEKQLNEHLVQIPS